MSEEKEAQLVAVFDHYGLNEPRYGEQMFKCPAHDDRKPSASVNRSKGLWHCHACGAGGDAIALLQATEGWGYKQAAEFLTTLTGEAPRSSVKHRKPAKAKRWIPPRLRSTA